MAELVIIAPLSPMKIGDEFEQGGVPLHLTALPTIRVPPNQLQPVLVAIGEVAMSNGPVEVQAVGYEQFGDAQDVSVTIIDPSPQLRQLHLELLEAARMAGARPRRYDYNADGYRPHISHTHDAQAVRPGESVTLTALAVLDCSEPTRRISAICPLSDDSLPAERTE
ncbi:2'-5' RNA ligase family protein [Microlunatus elymi]|uniref:2'-5' RNA ligase family protein n=1 Tax=Microlunatus elymi TaxID=2596828 RepID=A0A516PZJ7_9ACTN|nr:2'-5' RNA ligase family protein [Microlunatus elymi]QDP96401.1 2'-5' RNA ligase family protein [Microlunatus elymi]